MKLCSIFTCVFGLSLLSHSVQADVFRPAYLQLNQTESDIFDVMWKVPVLDAEIVQRVGPLFPADTLELSPRSIVIANDSSVQRWKIRVPGGLEGKPIAFTNLQGTGLDVLVRVQRLDGSQQLERILPLDPYFSLKPSPGPWEVVTTYTLLGTEHILAGIDHLLFVMALVMIVKGARRLLITITAFTVAHSITLALATLDVVHIPGPPVEATIALSIVFVASEILHLRQGREGLAARKPWLVAFSFGLLHGLGFAGALAEVGLPQNAIPLALLFFNIGVEIGQLLFIAAILQLIYMSRKYLGGQIVQNVPLVTAYGIGGVASFWVIERVSAFWI
jgi:hydrogenase/urease accessory protein HupE